jgi:hypothetical protein
VLLDEDAEHEALSDRVRAREAATPSARGAKKRNQDVWSQAVPY